MLNAFQGEEHLGFFHPSDAPQAALLVHGFPGSAKEMRPAAALFEAMGWTTQGLLLPGFGPDIATLGQRSHTEWTGAILQALEDLQATHNHVVLVGNSMGGALSIYAAAQGHVDGLVLFAPFYRVDHFLWKALPILRYIIPKFRPFQLYKPDFNDPEFQKGTRNFIPNADFEDPEFRKQTLQLEVDTRIFANIRQVGIKAEQAAPDVTAPALVIQGDADELVTPENTRHLTDRLSGDVTYLEIAADHNPLEPDKPYWHTVAAAIHSFAQKVTPA